jgi:hypothetical protein
MTTSSSSLRVSSPPASRPVFIWITLLTLLLGICVAPLGAAEDRKEEKPYALIFGTVWGPDDLPVYGVRILIRRADKKKAKWELISNHHGEFAQRVPAGRADYVITADVKGYKSMDGKKLTSGEEVTVHVENDERVDTGLHLK